MNCHSEYQPFQLNNYQHQYNTVAQQQQQQQQHYQQQNFVNYQQPFDQRPAPSFRIEDILLQGGKPGGHSPLPYGGLYPGQQYPAYPSAPLQHGCIEERDYQDQMAPGVDGLPMYFRLKQNHGRTMSGRKCRKPRTVFSELQLMVLEREFNDHKYLSTPQRTKLADRLGLNQTQVKTWYQNRRMKWKKESSDCSSEAKKSKQDDANVTTDYAKTFPINQTSASQEPLNRAISHM